MVMLSEVQGRILSSVSLRCQDDKTTIFRNPIPPEIEELRHVEVYDRKAR